MAIVWSCCVAFTLGIAYGIYAETGGIIGVIAAITFLGFVAYSLSRDIRLKSHRTNFNEQE